jgi:Tol biopolymer transport system component
MSLYNKTERGIARILDLSPGLKKKIKKVYGFVNYHLWADKAFKFELDHRCNIFALNHLGEEITHEETFFGYYDKSPWSKDMRFIIYHSIQKGLPSHVDINVYDTVQKNVTKIGSTSLWNYQQGSMLQWVYEEDQTFIVYNKINESGFYGSLLLNFDTKQERLLDRPIQTIHPQKLQALTLNYYRLNKYRPEYGYSHSNQSSLLPLEKDGIWSVDLKSGEEKLLITIKELKDNLSKKHGATEDHKINHIMFSPDGNKFVFMHRWFTPQGKFSRLYTANADGTGLCLLMDDKLVSHYSWMDSENLVVYGRSSVFGDRYYQINVNTKKLELLGKDALDQYGDGHPSISPNKKWLITDTYPDRKRQRHLLLFQLETKELIHLGRFISPLHYDGANRCDLHPRWSPDGNYISIDSVHEGKRMMYIIDVSAIVN